MDGTLSVPVLTIKDLFVFQNNTLNACIYSLYSLVYIIIRQGGCTGWQAGVGRSMHLILLM